MSLQSARTRATEWCAMVCAFALVLGGVVAFDRDVASGDQVVVAERVQSIALTPPPEATLTPEVDHHAAPSREPAVASVAVDAPNPVPAAAPRPRPSDGLKALGTIELPKIGMTQTLYEGVELSILQHGPGLWPGRGVPGHSSGNAVVAGHRTTHTRPFRHIDELREGDEVIFRMGDATFVYKVTEYFPVKEEEASWIVNHSSDPIVTLFACHPPGSRRYRYVVRGALVSPIEPTPTPAPLRTPTPTPTPRRGLLDIFG